MYLGVSNLCGCTMPQSLLMISFKLVGNTSPTAQKTVFPRSWNIMESSKRPSKHLCIKCLAKKFHNSHHRKVQKKNLSLAHNKNFSVISKHHVSINFLHQKRLYFQSPKISKQELFSNQ